MDVSLGVYKVIHDQAVSVSEHSALDQLLTRGDRLGRQLDAHVEETWVHE